MEALAVAVVPIAMITQVSIAFGRSRGTRSAEVPFRVAGIAVAVGCLALLSLAVDLDAPADCAPLSDGRHVVVVAALAICLLTTGVLAVFSLRGGGMHRDVRVFVGGELAACTGAAILFGVLAGATSC